MIFFTFEHLYIITAWFLIDFSERNGNGNILFEILSLSGKLLYLATWKSTLLQIIQHKVKCCWPKYSPKYFIDFLCSN